jgi:hypothetical protein
MKNKDYIYFKFELGGNSICGDKSKPRSCRDCGSLSTCALDMFYDQLSSKTPDIDPLDVLREWRSHAIDRPHSYNSYDHMEKIYCDEMDLIKQLKENPYAVIERGRKERWLK